MSIAGAIEAFIKLNSIVPDYAQRACRICRAPRTTPTPDIVIGRFVTPQGENIDVVLDARRRAPGLVFWTLCVTGDYVLYFNRARLAAGILAILVALSEIPLPVAEAAGVTATVTELVQALSLGALSVLVRR